MLKIINFYKMTSVMGLYIAAVFNQRSILAYGLSIVLISIRLVFQFRIPLQCTISHVPVCFQTSSMTGLE